jgi:hypothetical protein
LNARLVQIANGLADIRLLLRFIFYSLFHRAYPKRQRRF